MGKRKITTLNETVTGGALSYTVGKKEQTRAKTVKEVKEGKHPGYHIIDVNGTEYVRSNPDPSTSNNVDPT